MDIKIKNQYLSTTIGYGGSALPLGERDFNSLIQLAEIAYNSKSKTLKNYFETLPSLEEIKEYKGKKFIQKVKNASTSKKK